MGKMRYAYKILVEEAERKSLFETLGKDGTIILDWILRK